MFKNWCIYILALAGTFTFFLFYQMWMAWYCLVLLLCIPPLSLIMCLLSIRKRKVHLIAPRNVKIGDEASVELAIPECLANMISFLRIDYSFTEKMTGERIRRKMYIHGNTHVSIPVNADHCGAFAVEVTRIKIYDLFGLFWTRQKPHSSCEVIVHPVPQIPEAMPDLNGFKARTLKKSTSPYSEIYDVREYVLGDLIKNIHWKASAKRDDLLVKEPQEECFGHARVFLELEKDREIFDRKMGELVFTSEYFLKKDIPHKIRVLPPRKREISFDIQSPRDLEKAVIRILNMKIPKEASDEN
ncbi:MAG: DUF58 domain-containing protein [Clostridiales bacterium]|nr:DUF58 domain-containing protein [Clostridiales bacterium]